MDEKADALRILDLDGNPTPEDVRQAFREKIMRFHPDVTDGTDENAKQLNAARDLLLAPSNELERFQYLEATITRQESRFAAQADASRLGEAGVRRAGATLKQQQRVANIAAIAAAITTGLGQVIDKVAGDSTGPFAGEISLVAVLVAVSAVLVSFGLGLKVDRTEQSIRDLEDQLSERPYLSMCLVEIFKQSTDQPVRELAEMLRQSTDQSVRKLSNSEWNTRVERWLAEGRVSADLRAGATAMGASLFARLLRAKAVAAGLLLEDDFGSVTAASHLS